jgi:transmembrane sensor
VITANKRDSSDPARAARVEASAWIVQLHGPRRTPAVEAGFRTWLAESTENARQFELVTDAWDAGSTPVPGIGRLKPHAKTSARMCLAAAVLVTFAMGLGFWALDAFSLNPSYATGIGEQRIVVLADGTRITLNSDTHVSVAYRELERGVRVDRGEAYFEVAKDVARPFLVRAGVHRVEALGTVFIVRHDAARTAVTLVEGKIAVSVEGDDALEIPASLTPGERLTFVGKSRAKIDEPRIEAITAWRRSEIVLDKTPLADAIAEVNRYDQTMLVIDDPQIACLPVSGVYHTGNSETFAAMIAQLYGLETVRRNGRIALKHPN